MQDAETEYRCGVELLAELEEGGELARAHADLGAVLHATGRTREALEQHDRALEIVEPLADASGELAHELGRICMDRGLDLETLGLPEAALAAYRRGCDVLGSVA